MQKPNEEYSVGVLDIYGFEIFQVGLCLRAEIHNLSWLVAQKEREGRLYMRMTTRTHHKRGCKHVCDSNGSTSSM